MSRQRSGFWFVPMIVLMISESLCSPACSPSAEAPVMPQVTAPRPRQSQSLALSADGALLAVVNPDADSLSIIDTAKRQLRREAHAAAEQQAQAALRACADHGSLGTGAVHVSPTLPAPASPVQRTSSGPVRRNCPQTARERRNLPADRPVPSVHRGYAELALQPGDSSRARVSRPAGDRQRLLEVADRVGKVWGLGSETTKDPGPWEGEQRNMWKPTQVPHLWVHGGNLHQSRHYSQFLAFQLKARLEGLPTPVYKLAPSYHKR